ncbi:hypothetical protein SSABA_v1c06380 [Spiroplasma sabaudiense Ar-1343]|uniref:Dihydrolipoamide acetyltransferase component of pyruvate dehydrogenase complex n=1 Tax=Spiroplasma sabaudiense Ar-1343 TaxID=1276257 RepID=W6AB03_9MOLU|nr:2-oxo acid dehydrogenase subunit E2 [Spiroplasma sabaudiense]AHI54040.1 hypothetical protein SSABA_v1c06380 [Spiroplasma sabaudiense Ar-1343]
MNRIKFKTNSNLKGIVEKVYVFDGDIVEKGQVIAKISTQLETFDIIAHVNGVIKNINILESLIVSNGDIIFDIFSEQEVKNIHGTSSVGRTLKDVITEKPRYNAPKYDKRDQEIYENAQTMTMEVLDGEEKSSILVETVNMKTRPINISTTQLKDINLEEQLSEISQEWEEENDTNTLEMNRVRFDDLTSGFDGLTQELKKQANLESQMADDSTLATALLHNEDGFNLPASSLLSDLDKSSTQTNNDDLFEQILAFEDLDDFDVKPTVETSKELSQFEVDFSEKPMVEDLNSNNIKEIPQKTTDFSDHLNDDTMTFNQYQNSDEDEKPQLSEINQDKVAKKEPEKDFLHLSSQDKDDLKESSQNPNFNFKTEIEEIKKSLASDLKETQSEVIDESLFIKNKGDSWEKTIKEFNFLTKTANLDNSKGLNSQFLKKSTNTKSLDKKVNEQVTPSMTIDVEIDLTSLTNLYDLMSRAFLEQGLELSLMAFFIKAILKARQKLLNHKIIPGLEEQNAIQYSLFSVKEMVEAAIFLDAEININELTRRLTDQRQEFQFSGDFPIAPESQISITDFGYLKLTRGQKKLRPGEFFNFGVGHIYQKPVAENNTVFIKNMVVVSMTFNCELVNLIQANNFLQDFSKYIINPGLLI